ncbi:hypothetical protein OBBRIDRAFT_47489 [Obba rivulosa]|uniref:Uncharacterized protein n=1 Tax=Obba rivulosa TaxID=1052685 RepID=A0A8E2DI66_9APHY|nr:hypothetical protein OBBRIDRAFT_47489 [Obba rivulosa]
MGRPQAPGAVCPLSDSLGNSLFHMRRPRLPHLNGPMMVYGFRSPRAFRLSDRTRQPNLALLSHSRWSCLPHACVCELGCAGRSATPVDGSCAWQSSMTSDAHSDLLSGIGRPQRGVTSCGGRTRRHSVRGVCHTGEAPPWRNQRVLISELLQPT